MYKALISFCNEELDIAQGEILASDFASAEVIADLLEAGYIEEYTDPSGGAKIEVVTELPETGEANVIYLVPKQDEDENNVFDEYLYVNDEWELIGTTDIDLSNYYTKAQVDAKLPPIYHFHSTINLDVNWNTDEQPVALPSSDYAIMAGIIQDAYSKNLTNFLIYLTTNMSNRSPMLFTSERSSEMITSKPSSITMYALTSTLNNRMNSKNPMLNNFQLWIQLTWSGDAPTITSIEMIGVKARCLTPTSTYNYTPSADYNPATKKYVDDSIAAAITTTLGGSY